jgi:hypothetical protein
MCNEDVLDSINMCNEVGVSEEMGRDPLLRSDVGDEEDDEDDDDEEDEETSESEGITLILLKPLLYTSIILLCRGQYLRNGRRDEGILLKPLLYT